MEFKEKQLMSGDCLALGRYISFDIFNCCLGQIMVKILLVIHTFSMLVHFVYFLNKPDPDQFMTYVPMFCWTFTGTVASLILLITPNWAINMKTDMKFWPESSAGKYLEKKIKRESFQATVLSALFTISVIGIITVTDFNGTESDRSFFLMCRLLKDNPIFLLTDVLYYIYKLSCIPFIYITTVHAQEVVYFTLHIKFQMCLLEEYLANLTSDQKLSDPTILKDRTYQDLVRKRLKFCIRRYNQILVSSRKIAEKIANMTPVFAMTSLSHGIGCSIFLFTGRPFGVVKSLLPFTVHFMTVAIIIIFGQMTEDHGDHFFEALISNPWYTWDIKNRKLLLIAMHGFVQSSPLQFTKEVSVNYKLGIFILKGIFSAASVLFQIKMKKT